MRTRNRLPGIVYWAFAVSASPVTDASCLIAAYVSQAIDPKATTRMMTPNATRFITHPSVTGWKAWGLRAWGLKPCGDRGGAVCAGDSAEVVANAETDWFTLDIQVPRDRPWRAVVLRQPISLHTRLWRTGYNPVLPVPLRHDFLRFFLRVSTIRAAAKSRPCSSRVSFRLIDVETPRLAFGRFLAFRWIARSLQEFGVSQAPGRKRSPPSELK